MASAWGGSWGSAWGNSWGTVAEALNPSNLDGHVRMYGGGGFGAYRVRDEDVDALMRVLYRTRKKRRKRVEKIKELEQAAMALLNTPDAPEIRRVLVDFAGPLLAAKARQAELQTAVQALLQKAADEAARLHAELEADEEDVMMLLGAL